MHDRRAWLMGGEARCGQADSVPNRMWRVVLLGAPGVGKGTQAELLGETLRACALSMGDVFRAARGSSLHSPAMAAALTSMDSGELVPDQIVLPVLLERRGCLRCDRGLGFILDGFPRTVAQAAALESLLHAQEMTLDAVVNYELPIETILARLAGRRFCPACQAVYHLQDCPPRTSGRCDRCAAALEQRGDDQPALARARMAAFARSTEPLLEFYRKRKVLVTVAAHGAPQEILARTLSSARFAGHERRGPPVHLGAVVAPDPER
jgi:adenylate kinase